MGGVGVMAKPAFTSCINTAREKIRPHPHYALLAEAAHADLQAYLLQRLNDTSAPLLALKNAIVRARRLPFAAQDCQSSEDWQSWCQECPLLAGLMDTLADFWIETVAEFLQRLADDWHRIEQTFGVQNQSVSAVQAGLSDPHRRGRSVFILQFDSGLKLVYKPRDLGIDAAFFGFLTWLNPHLSLPFQTLKIIPREHYGWMEYAPESPPRGVEEISRYSHRAGALLAVLYLLDGTDMQRDNLIVAGEQPLFIDLETLLQPSVAHHNPCLGQQRFSDSVLRCGFLLNEIGALSKTPDVEVEAFSAGFAELYRLLLQYRAELLRDNSPLAAFADQTVRPIFQDTALYQRLLQQSLHAKYLQSEDDRRACLAFLYRLSNEAAIPRIEAEIAALEQLDIPYFTANSSENTLFTPEPMADFFLEAPYQRLFVNLKGLNAADLARQLGYVQSSIYLAGSQAPAWESGAGSSSFPHRQAELGTPHSQAGAWERALLACARTIAGQIRETALPTRYGGVTWVIPERIGQSYRLQPADFGLYNGISGICLFLAALDKVTANTAHQSLIHRAMHPLQDALSDARQRQVLARQLNLGMATGIGGLIYGCTQLGLFDTAQQAAALLTADTIAADHHHDLLAGAAGAMLGLLSLYQHSQDEKVLQQALDCAQHLLTRRITDTTGYHVWQTLNQQAISGFGHGTAGIAYALLRLYQASAANSYRDAAAEAIAFENSLFSAEAKNWYAFGSSAQAPVFWTSFCHGAAGIGLARLAGLPMLDTPQIRRDIEHAIQTTQNYTMNHLDFLCCGHAGRLEFLALATERLQRPELHAVVREKTAWILQRQAQRGDYFLFEEFPPRLANPNLFKGSAGIGYQWLRLAFPEKIPSLLSFDA